MQILEDKKFECYGSTVIGEKGQIVLPIRLRKKFKINKGDEFIVLTGEKMGGWGVIIVKANVMTGMLAKIFNMKDEK